MESKSTTSELLKKYEEILRNNRQWDDLVGCGYGGEYEEHEREA